MANVIRKAECKDCTVDWKKDNLAIYDDGHTFCFACQTHTKGDEVEVLKTEPENKTILPLFKGASFLPLKERGISKEVCEKFNYQTDIHTKDEIANYIDEYGSIVWQKVRNTDKQFYIRGDASNLELYGKHRYAVNPNLFITITEGEIDALSIAEACGAQWPVVSIPTGANTAKKVLSKHLAYLQSFKYVILAFDNDEAGQKATKECVELFEPGKVRVATWRLKDANDLLVLGLDQEIKDTIWNAKEIRPDNLCSLKDLRDEILKPTQVGIEWPWKGLTDLTYGMRQSQFMVIGAGTGIGKTSFVQDIVLHMVQQEKIHVGYFSFEQQASDTGKRLIGGVLNRKIHLPGNDPTAEEIDPIIDQLDDYIVFQRNYGGVSLEDLVPKLRYLAKSKNTKLFVIDHLSALASKIQGDERIGIDKVMAVLGALTRELDVCIILVVHLARTSGAGLDYAEGLKPGLRNFRGSGAIETWADSALGLSRNAMSLDPQEQSLLCVEEMKARLDGAKRGKSFNLMYNQQTGILEDVTTCLI